MEYILEKNNLMSLQGDDNDGENRVTSLLMMFLKYRLTENGNNILHILPTNEKFLHLFAKVINILVDDCEFTEAESYYFSVVYPNNQGLTPLDIAIHERASRSVEIMLDMLSMRP